MHPTHPNSAAPRSVITYRLPARHGWAVLPDPTREHGGLVPAVAGVRAEVNIGAARDMDAQTAARLAAVLGPCHAYDVVGDDMDGMLLVTRALDSALNSRGEATA